MDLPALGQERAINEEKTNKPMPAQQIRKVTAAHLRALAHFRTLNKRYQAAVSEWNKRWAAQYQIAARIDRDVDQLNASLAKAAKTLQPALDRLDALLELKRQVTAAAVRVLEQRIAKCRRSARKGQVVPYATH
jgi:hypothetical protein